MRNGLVAVALLIATGCTTDAMTFSHDSQVETMHRGVAMLDDAPSAQIGMVGNTCQADTNTGMIGTDIDVATGAEESPVDASTTETLVIAEQGAYVVDQNSWGMERPVVEANDIVAAQFTDDGIVTLSDNGGTTTVDWFGNNGQPEGSVTLPAGDYNTGLTVDKSTGVVYVPGTDGVVVASQDDGATTLADGASLAAWDATANVLYVATEGMTEVRALEVDGSTRWTVDVGAPVVSIDDMGPQGAAAVMVGDQSAGELVVLDGATGAVVASMSTPSAAQQVMVGNNGRSMAMVLPNEVHFFSVNLSALP